jgi:cell division protein FtsN
MKLHSQQGGAATGFIIGLVIGLAAALAVAIYVTKVPTPFTNKNQPRSAEQDAAEAQKNKDWNPNSGLQNKPAAADDKESNKDAAKDAVKEPSKDAKDTAKEAAKDGKEPAKDAGKETAKEVGKPEPKPAVTADPLGELVKSKAPSTAIKDPTGSDPFTYFVQAGAFRSQAEADAHRAKLAMMGLDAKISEREQAGRLVYRVRLGPYDDKDVAENAKSRLDKNGIETALVRVQR